MKHKNLSRGFSHHLLLPIIAVLLVGAIGGYVMLRSSDAASSSACRYKTYAKGAKSECVRYAQYMLGVSHDAIFGSGTQAALVKKTGQSRLNSTAWSNLCGRSYSTTVNKQRDAACKGGKYVTELGNPTIGYRVCTSISYTTPSSQAYEPSKPVCKKRTTYKGAGAKAKAQKQQQVVNKVKSQYKLDVSAYKSYVKSNKSYTQYQINQKCTRANKVLDAFMNSENFKITPVK